MSSVLLWYAILDKTKHSVILLCIWHINFTSWNTADIYLLNPLEIIMLCHRFRVDGLQSAIRQIKTLNGPSILFCKVIVTNKEK